MTAWALAPCESNSADTGGLLQDSSPPLLHTKHYDDGSSGDGDEDDGAGDNDDDDDEFQKFLWLQIPVLTISLGQWQPPRYKDDKVTDGSCGIIGRLPN